MDTQGPRTVTAWPNPRDTLTNCLPKLNLRRNGTQSTHSSSLQQIVFAGDMAPWTEFNREVWKFFTTSSLKEALYRTRNAPVLVDPQVSYNGQRIENREQRYVGAEIDLDGRFGQNVLDAVSKAVKTLHNLCTPKLTEKDDLTGLPDEFIFGSSKITPTTLKLNENQPDVIFLTLNGNHQERYIPAVGELKSYWTFKVQKAREDRKSKARASFRHFLGQVVRDMTAYGATHGFVSTYEETVFLQITINKGKPRLLVSETIKRTDRAKPGNGKCESVSVRLGIAFMLHQARHSSESLRTYIKSISGPEWIEEKFSDTIIPDRTPYTGTPQNDYQTWQDWPEERSPSERLPQGPDSLENRLNSLHLSGALDASHRSMSTQHERPDDLNNNNNNNRNRHGQPSMHESQGLGRSFARSVDNSHDNSRDDSGGRMTRSKMKKKREGQDDHSRGNGRHQGRGNPRFPPGGGSGSAFANY